MSEITTIIGKTTTPHSIVSELNAVLPEIDKIYVVYKRKDGEYIDIQSGDLEGLGFVILLLQRVANKYLEAQE